MNYDINYNIQANKSVLAIFFEILTNSQLFPIDLFKIQQNLPHLSWQYSYLSQKLPFPKTLTTYNKTPSLIQSIKLIPIHLALYTKTHYEDIKIDIEQLPLIINGE